MYRIIGTGPEEVALRRVASQLGLSDVVRFLGELPTDDVIAEYRSSDVLLHAALEDAFPVVVLEAQAVELPVVATDAGGLRETVDDGVTGYVVPCRDAAALAEKLILFAKDRALRLKMGTAARDRALRLFDIRHEAARTAALYAELVNPDAALCGSG